MCHYPKRHQGLTSDQQYPEDVSIEALMAALARHAGVEASQELIRNILDVMLRTPPPATREEWSEGVAAVVVRCCRGAPLCSCLSC